ncbi:MAG: OmpA family protein [Phycisphaerae bacterium]
MTGRTLAMGSVLGVVLASAFVTGGCVPQAEYDKVVAANRRANEQLLQCQEALENTDSRMGQLREQLSERDAALQSLRREKEVLQQAKDDLQDSFDKLQELYDKAVADASQPQELPPFTLPQELDEDLRAFARQHPDMVEYLPEYGMVKFRSNDLTFERGSDEVRAEASDALQQFVDIVTTPAAEQFHVYVAGHTDDIPIRRQETLRRHPNNWYLSVHRAVAVQEVLEDAGLNPGRIGVMGFGEYHPIEPNEPDQGGNPANRRVEIWLVPPERFLTQEADLGQAQQQNTVSGSSAENTQK